MSLLLQKIFICICDTLFAACFAKRTVLTTFLNVVTSLFMTGVCHTSHDLKNYTSVTFSGPMKYVFFVLRSLQD